MMLASEAALDVLAVSSVALCLFALAVSLRYSIPASIRRVRRYPKPGSRRSYAQKELFLQGTLTGLAVLFLLTGIFAAVLPDGDTRAIISRLLVFAVIAGLTGLIVVTPLWQSRVEYQAEQEIRENRRRED